MTDDATSPFHAGERAVQRRAGAHDRVARTGRRFVRDHLNDEQRDFYAQLPSLFVGSVDRVGRPWASVLFGRPGFLTSSDPRHLDVTAKCIHHDPLNENLIRDAPLGLLGINLSTKRRHRLNGRVSFLQNGRFRIKVAQAFGNCPQYIQSRDHTVLPDIDRIAEPRPVKELQRLDERARHIISRADTLFIASHLPGIGDTAGTDISHRGGKPGFVRIDADGLLTMPDFPGNQFFNTLGNVHLNPKVGLLFIDFRTRGLLSMTGHAEIVWKGEEVQLYSGAERLIKFRLDKAILWERTVPIRWRFRGWSRSLDRTGSW
ncbi:pyridoxamine 5'-phosphate oxidase family protein [Lentisalinibacter salinarum]|uniref:pyridoxamine 5'-phosphate oxidase family protein n=1 Tax=Lentisalinibacter salinarum TaxID=2992239 RepID=UPI0038686045